MGPTKQAVPWIGLVPLQPGSNHVGEGLQTSALVVIPLWDSLPSSRLHLGPSLHQGGGGTVFVVFLLFCGWQTTAVRLGDAKSHQSRQGVR